MKQLALMLLMEWMTIFHRLCHCISSGFLKKPASSHLQHWVKRGNWDFKSNFIQSCHFANHQYGHLKQNFGCITKRLDKQANKQNATSIKRATILTPQWILWQSQSGSLSAKGSCRLFSPQPFWCCSQGTKYQHWTSCKFGSMLR